MACSAPLRSTAALLPLTGLLLALAMAPTMAQPAPASVDGRPITEADIAIALEELSGTIPPQLNDAQRRDYAIDYLIDLALVARAAEREKLGDDEMFRRRLEQNRQRLLMEVLLTREGERAVTEDAMRRFYDETVSKLPKQDEVRARHILVETEAQARAVLVRLRAGEDFAKVAGELSKDPGSGREGGDLGWFTRERMVPEFAEAAFALAKGALSDPVRSQFGYHIIQVDDRREKAPPPFDAVRDQLRRYMMQKGQQDFVLKLREGAKIERAAPARP